MVTAFGALAYGEAVVFLHDVAVGADKVGHFLYVAERLKPVFAHLEAIDGSDGEEPVADDFGGAAQQGHAVLPRRGTPAGVGGACGSHGAVNVGGGAVLEAAHLHVGVDRAVGRVGRSCLDPLAVDVHAMRTAQVGTSRLESLFVIRVQQGIRAAQGGVSDFELFAGSHHGIRILTKVEM